jgi:hypothetical protein
MRIIYLLPVLLLSACSTTLPVTAKFPDSPGVLVQAPCPQLQKLQDNAQLSDIARTVTVNYTTYYECAVKLDAWIKWYSEQKTIFETLGK